jgi:hypothetical protein
MQKTPKEQASGQPGGLGRNEFADIRNVSPLPPRISRGPQCKDLQGFAMVAASILQTNVIIADDREGARYGSIQRWGDRLSHLLFQTSTEFAPLIFCEHLTERSQDLIQLEDGTHRIPVGVLSVPIMKPPSGCQSVSDCDDHVASKDPLKRFLYHKAMKRTIIHWAEAPQFTGVTVIHLATPDSTFPLDVQLPPIQSPPVLQRGDR